MTKFIIEKVQLRNFRNVEDQMMEMDFPLNNLTVFTGKVGAGKSTIFKAISMALYGDDGGVKNEKLTVEDMVNDRTGKNLEVHLFFTGTNTLTNVTDKYEIHLYHKHSKMNNKLVLMKNGVDISANGKMDTYRLIEKITIPKEVYYNMYYFTQQAKNFFTALPNSEQKAIFDSVLDLGEYDIYYENCKTKIVEFKKKSDELELQLNLIQSNMNEKVQLIDNEKKSIEKLISDSKAEIELLESKIKDLESDISVCKSKMELEFTTSQINEEITKRESDTKIKITTLESDIKSLNEKVQTIKDKYQTAFAEKKVIVKEELDKVLEPLKEQARKAEEELNNKKVEVKSKWEITTASKDKEISEIKHKYETSLVTIKNDITNKKSEIETLQSSTKTEILEKQTELSQANKEEESAFNDLGNQILHIKVECDADDNDINHKQQVIDANNKQLSSDTPICDKCHQPLVNLDHLKEENKKLEEEIQVLKDSKQKKLLEIQKLEEDKKKHLTKINEIQEEFKSYKAKKIEEYNEKKIVIENAIKELEEKNQKLSLDESQEISSLETKYTNEFNTIKTEFHKFEDAKKQEIEETNGSIELHTNNAKNKLIELSQKMTADQNAEISQINLDIDSKTQEKTKVYNECEEYVKQLRSKKFDAEIMETKLHEKEQNLLRLQSDLSSKKNLKVSDETLKSLTSNLETDKQKFETVKSEKEECDKTLEILEFWKTAFSDAGIKSMLIDVAIPHMNRCVKEELDRVYPGVFTVSFDTLTETKSGNIRDKFSINVVHNLKCATGHKKLSGGEKRIIDFCCMAALRSLAEKLYGKMFSHIFYDEVMDSLDSESRELFCRSMKNQTTDGRNITLITHALTEDVDPDRVFPF